MLRDFQRFFLSRDGKSKMVNLICTSMIDIPDVSVFCLYMIFERFGFLEIRKKIVGIFYIVANILIRKNI